MEGAEPFAGFEHAAAILHHLGQHLCVAFQERSTVTHFTLHDCAYGPAKHIAKSMWSDILGHVLVPQAARLSSQQLQLKLDALHAAPVEHKSSSMKLARCALARLNFA
jgi:hypothetical protein